MKKLMGVLVAIGVVIGIILGFKCTTHIPVGYEGIVYSYKDGVSPETLNSGLKFKPLFSKVEDFSVAEEQLVLSKDSREGSEDDESFSIVTSDNSSIGIDLQMSYGFDPEKVVKVYQKYRGMDGEDIVNKRVKTILKSKINEISGSYSTMDIYSTKRTEVNKAITEYLDKEFYESFGMHVYDATIINTHLDAKLQEAIENKVKAIQEKDLALAEQEKIKVEAETNLIKAEAEAKIKVTEAEAEAEANRLLADSITQPLIDMKEADAHMKHGFVTVQGAGAVVTE